MEIRRQTGIKPGMALDVRATEGRIEIEPAPLRIRLERRGRLVVAVTPEAVPALNNEIVGETRRKLRQERRG